MRNVMCFLMIWLLACAGCNSLCDPGHPSILCPSDLSNSCPSTDGTGGDGAGDDGTGDEGTGGSSSDDGSGNGLGGATGATTDPGSTTDPGNTTDPGPTTDPDPGARRPPRIARRHPRRWRGGLGVAQQADCPDPGEPVNVPPPASMVPSWQPLTTAMLRQIAKQNNIGTGKSGIQLSHAIGLAFENWVLTTIKVYPEPPNPGRNTASFTSQARKTNTGGVPASVIPELVNNQTGTTWDINTLSVTTVYFDLSVFYEVKAVTAPITPGTSNWQILGLLDVARNVKKPPPPYPPPAVLFITTGGTTISTTGTTASPGVVAQATMWSVGVWQQTVSYNATTSADPNNPDLRLEAATCLNPGVYAGWMTYHVNAGQWPVSPLTSPTTPPTSLEVPGDPDPAEVD